MIQSQFQNVGMHTNKVLEDVQEISRISSGQREKEIRSLKKLQASDKGQAHQEDATENEGEDISEDEMVEIGFGSSSSPDGKGKEDSRGKSKGNKKNPYTILTAEKMQRWGVIQE